MTSTTLARADGLRMWTEVRHLGSDSEVHTWYLVGPTGAVQFKAARYVSGPLLDIARKYRDLHEWLNGEPWTGYDVGYHSPVARYDGQDPIDDDCPIIGGGACYYDGSSLQAQHWLAGFVYPPSAPESWWWLYDNLRAYYLDAFSQDEYYASPVTAMIAALRANGADR